MFSEWTKTNKTAARVRSTGASIVTWICKTHGLLTGGPQITRKKVDVEKILQFTQMLLLKRSKKNEEVYKN